MSDLVQVGQGIEGDSIEGQSRKPLINRGLTKHNGIQCHRFEANFDVKAKIEQTLSSDGKRIDPHASTSLNDQVICDKAFIHSKKAKYSKDLTTGSATHKTNTWRFPQQTSVAITHAHQEILNAISKRRSHAIECDE